MPSKTRKKKGRSVKALISSNETPQGSTAHELSIDTTKQFETLHIEDNKHAGLSLPQVSVTVTSPTSEQHKAVDTNSPKESSFRRRLRSLTTSSTRTGLNGQSLESKSSLDSPDPSSIAASTITPSPEGKGSVETASPGKVIVPSSLLKYMRPGNDFMYFDIDLLEADAMDNRMNSGLMAKVDNPRTPEMGKSTFDELIEYVRRVTGTETTMRPTGGDSMVPGRQGDIRSWDHKNLCCITCRGPCPLCDASCCVREEARRKIADETFPSEEIEQAKRLAKIIDFLGVYAKDAGTYSLCSVPGGCGRHVCPRCCGGCPSVICQDIQCTECKKNVWGPCDWHE